LLLIEDLLVNFIQMMMDFSQEPRMPNPIRPNRDTQGTQVNEFKILDGGRHFPKNLSFVLFLSIYS